MKIRVFAHFAFNWRQSEQEKKPDLHCNAKTGLLKDEYLSNCQ